MIFNVKMPTALTFLTVVASSLITVPVVGLKYADSDFARVGAEKFGVFGQVKC